MNAGAIPSSVGMPLNEFNDLLLLRVENVCYGDPSLAKSIAAHAKFLQMQKHSNNRNKGLVSSNNMIARCFEYEMKKRLNIQLMLMIEGRKPS